MSKLHLKFSNNGEPANPEAANKQDGNQPNMRTKIKTKVIEVNGNLKALHHALNYKRRGWTISEIGWTTITLTKEIK